VLKLFLLLVLFASFGDATKLFIAIYLFFLRRSGGYLPNYFPHVLK
jgi:hypothetical protein